MRDRQGCYFAMSLFKQGLPVLYKSGSCRNIYLHRNGRIVDCLQNKTFAILGACMYQHPFHRGLLCDAGINLFGSLSSGDLECPPWKGAAHTSTNCPLGNLAVPHDLLTRGPFQINQISPSTPPSRIIFDSSEQ